jgi:hypothetical protein
MRRIAIIDHSAHTLFVEDIDEDVLENEYNGDEQAYIDDNYTFEGEYSWDYIVDAEYLQMEDKTPIEIDFDEIADIY